MRTSTLAWCGVLAIVACEGRSTIQKGDGSSDAGDTGGTGGTSGTGGKGGSARGGTGGGAVSGGGAGARGGRPSMLDGGGGGRSGSSAALGGDAGAEAGAGAVAGALGGGSGSGGDAGESAGGAPGGTAGDAGIGGVGGEPGPHKLPDGVCPDAAVYSPGAVQCQDNSFIHRPEALGCALPARDPDDLPSDAGAEPWASGCNQDKDCPNDGYCVRYFYYDGSDPIHECITPCAADADCGAGEACLCEPYVHNVSRDAIGLGRCAPATCLTDADCGDGKFCRSPLVPADCLHDKRWPAGLSCQRSVDRCSGIEECAQSGDIDYFTACDQVGDAFACVPKRSWCE